MNIADQMRARYTAPEWAIFFEVANGPGSGLRRYADAIAMSLFPSRGLDVHGFEFKASRNDWLNELKKPEKADEIARYCDHWWLVVASKDIVKDGELPGPWGLLVSDGKELRQVKKPERLEPIPLSRKFVAAMFRRAHEDATNKLRIAEEVAKSYAKGVEDGKQETTWDADRTTEKLEALTTALNEFEAASGIKIDQYTDGNRLGEAAKAVLWMSRHDGPNELSKAANDLERAAKELRERAAAIEAVRPKQIA